ncbi:MAG TPA: hypothetical protein VEB66_10275 [Opitutaceae bacterium]|nr:hypothetical protein [Opitutaceae bacterium]
MPKSFPQFVRIDRERAGRSHHFVVHTGNPVFTLELMPDADAPDQAGKGVLKRLCVPNSWAGDYGQYARFVSAAQEFFAQSGLAVPGGPAPRL